GGMISLISAHAGELNDDLESWAGARGKLFLDGFAYDRLKGPTGAKERVEWLKHQWPNHLLKEFRPQPWEQLISALRATGHANAAREVAIARSDRLRRAKRVIRGARTLHWLYGALVGYGYRPVNLLIAIPVVWFGCAMIYGAAVHPSAGTMPYLVSTQDPKE